MTSLAKSAAYGMLDLWTRGRGVRRIICGEEIRFPARWSRWYASDYEPNTFAFLRNHCSAGDTALDIGAHFGLFTVLMARLVGEAGKVFAFEPTALSREILAHTVLLNGCGSVVEVRREAVCDRSGSATFHDTGSVASNANSLLRTNRADFDYTVPITSLDEFCESRNLRPRCLKIDVEGAELSLLHGAERTFLNDRPVALLSLHPPNFSSPKEELQSIWQVLADYQMQIRLLEPYQAAGEAWQVMTRDDFIQRNDLFDVEVIPPNGAG